MKYLYIIVFASVLLISLSGFVEAFNSPTHHIPPRVLVVTPSSIPTNVAIRNDLFSFKTSFNAAGLHFSEASTSSLTGTILSQIDLIVVPFASAKELSPITISLIRTAVTNGVDLLFDGESPLAPAMGVKLRKDPIEIAQIRSTDYTDILLNWQKHEKVKPVIEDTGYYFSVLYIDNDTEHSIGISSGFGKGKFIFLSPLFDPWSDRGYSRFPFLIENISKNFGYGPVAERCSSAMYYDPGNRNYKDADELAKFWKMNGVKRIYAGGWYFFDDYTYDYDSLIQACHNRGISVFCWLELPMVNVRFWNRHPEWREKTASLKEGHVDWRYLMNLADPACRMAVMDELRTLISQHDWDGVDLAELYFDTALGPSEPDSFTPMNNYIRNEFKKNSGFDPLEIFNASSKYYWKTDASAWKKFATYRRNLCNDLKDYFIKGIAEIAKKKNDFEIIMTAIDASQAPELEDNIAEDTSYLLELQKKYNLTIQAEDEWLSWSGKPERYDRLGKYYTKYILDASRLEIDLNVVDNHKLGEGGLPAEKPTGEEIRQATWNIDINNIRPVFYAEDTLHPFDFKNINMALARNSVISQVRIGQWDVKGSHSVLLSLNTTNVLLDKKRWRAGENGKIIVPSGHYSVEKTSLSGTGPSLLSISGELLDAKFFDNSISLSYEEPTTACYAVFNERPSLVIIDGKPVKRQIYMNKSTFSVKLPMGKHKTVVKFK